MLSLFDICRSLQESNTDLVHTLSIPSIVQFVRAAYALKEAIIHEQPPSFNPSHVPAVLPSRIHLYLARRFSLSDGTVSALWQALRIVIWTQAQELCEQTSDLAGAADGEDHLSMFKIGAFFVSFIPAGLSSDVASSGTHALPSGAGL